MPKSNEIVESALRLPEEQRAELARRILETLDEAPDTDVEEHWAREVARRLKDLADGKAVSIPAEEALAQARRRLTSD